MQSVQSKTSLTVVSCWFPIFLPRSLFVQSEVLSPEAERSGTIRGIFDVLSIHWYILILVDM
jgi:hypothetical protein